jgi:long-chain acyl-CoA synthetase
MGTRKPGSIGIALPDTDCLIVDYETGHKVMDPHEIGELLVRGPQRMSGYWKRPDETETAIRNDWLYTGELAFMDDDGYVFIVDRKKDLVISAGYNVYPREIEEVLYENPKVREVAAIGVPDSKRGEVVKVFIVPQWEKASVKRSGGAVKTRAIQGSHVEFRGLAPSDQAKRPA